MEKILLYIFTLCLFITACNKDHTPTFYPPALTLNAASGITRTTALLSGNIELRGDGKVSNCYFRLSASPQLENAREIAVPGTAGYTETQVSGLTAGTTYYYHLVASNGYSQIESDILHFQTLPNSSPTLTPLLLIHKGPFSAYVQCSIAEDGGIAPTMLGFKYQADTDAEPLFMPARQNQDGTFQAKLTGLNMETSYRVYAYAANPAGDTQSDTLTFLTDNAVYTTIPGTLPEIIGEQDKYRFSQLSIAGLLNGTDLRLIRDMLGQNIDGHETPGRLADLDLSDARIVSGGDSYSASRYTADDTLGYGTFAHSRYLQRIILPHSLKVIEKNAFLDCSALESITIPDSVREYTPSEGCLRLKEFRVSPLNPCFSSSEGILCDKKQEILFQYPEGKTAEKPGFPVTLTKIADQAFLRCPADTIILPETVKTLGAQVFLQAQARTIILSDNIRVLPSGTFQGCSQLQTVVLGTEASLLSDFCFEGCHLRDLYLRASYPPVCHSNTFSGTDLFSSCTLHVPPGCKTLYRQAKTWQNFEKITED